MMNHVATKIKSLPDWRGDAAVYALSPALKNGFDRIEHVVVSAVLDKHLGIHETYIFASDAEGTVSDYSELDGSTRDTLSHAEALHGAGYTIAADPYAGIAADFAAPEMLTTRDEVPQ